MTRAAAVLLVTLAGVARADDATARRLLREAQERWSDPSPDAAVQLAEEALAVPPSSPLVKASAHLFLGSLHQVRTGKLDLALASYDQVEALLRDDPSREARATLAQALVRKANIVYAERDDHVAALALYRRAQEAHALASTADTASQMCYRVGRGAAAPDERARWLDLALALAREAVDLVQQPPPEGRRGPRPAGRSPRAAFRAKFLVQLTLVLEALAKTDEAAAVWDEVDAADLDDNAQYQLALLHAVRGDLAHAAAALRRSLSVRPTVDTRNQLRKFIRGEPDFAGGLEREDWRDLVVDEAPAPEPQGAPTPSTDAGPR